MAANHNNSPSPLGNPPGAVSSSMSMGIPGTIHPALQSQSQSPFQTPMQMQHAQILAQLQSRNQAQFQAQLQAQGIGTSSSPSLSTPGTAGPKRPLPKPPAARPPGPGSATTASPFKTTELTPAAKRKKRKLPERQLPDKVANLLPESAIYTQLLEFEARIDAALMRKKVDIQESLKNPPCMQRILRLYVFNTFSNQSQTIPERKHAEPPSWSLKIVGRILEDGANTDPSNGGGMPKPTPQYPKFSSFFKRVTISLDPNLYPDNSMIVWENARAPAQQDGFEVKRKGDKEFNASIRLELNYAPEKFKLSPELSEVLGIEVDTRPKIIAAVWHYVKAKKLQNPSDPSFFACDPPLRKVFGEEKMKFAMASQKISQHLLPPQPIQLEHRIKLSGNNPAGNVCYDVPVDVPFPLQKEMSAFLANVEKHKEIDASDENICAALKKIHEHRRRRAFFLGFSQSPVEFINALIASQSRDLKLVAGEASRNAEKERRADFYNQPWVEDAVMRYLNRKPAADVSAIESRKPMDLEITWRNLWGDSSYQKFFLIPVIKYFELGEQ
ncbi:hypothetical protein ACLOJK_039854 [Asimina triloba]